MNEAEARRLTAKFRNIGANLRIRPAGTVRRDRRPADYAIDVVNTPKGETFDLIVAEEGLGVRIIDADPADRHLLLMVDGKRAPRRRKFLCGHDERHWFVAPVGARASSIGQAKEMLKPEAVRQRQLRHGVKPKQRNRRRNAAFVRQGEWFFVPCPGLDVEEKLILRNEPIARGRGRPHVVECLFRRGGTPVRVCPEYPSGITHEEYAELVRRDPDKAKLFWRNRVRDPEAYAKGRVRHPDHKTVVLRDWHRILPNTESRWMTEVVAFLD